MKNTLEDYKVGVKLKYEPADAIDNATTQANDFGVQKKGLQFNKTRSDSFSDTSTLATTDCPADDVISITPPINT
ncbi:MAG TPA: hypothetical protein VIH09_12225 [Flavobacterium sp.]|uniref:hypothetical protein n=1 Tax=Flavobacterium sp. TaxID=239 RepID=UPI002F3E6321